MVGPGHHASQVHLRCLPVGESCTSSGHDTPRLDIPLDEGPSSDDRSGADRDPVMQRGIDPDERCLADSAVARDNNLRRDVAVILDHRMVSNVITTPEEIIAEPADRVEFSHHAQMIEKIHQLPSVRQERVDDIKEAILNDTYMTTNKLDIAFDRLINEVVL